MDYSIISNSPLFSGMRPDEVSKVLDSTPSRLRFFKAGAMIAQGGETVPGLMVVLDGIVKGEMMDFAGRVIKIEDIPAPGVIASAFIFGNRNRFPVNVSAVTDCRILVIERNDFLPFLKKNDIILLNYLNIISNRSQFLSDKIKFLNFKTIKGKLSQYILQKAFPDKNEIVLDLTQSELAEFFGVARPSIARVISELEADGLLLTRGKLVKILDRKGLLLLASG